MLLPRKFIGFIGRAPIDKRRKKRFMPGLVIASTPKRLIDFAGLTSGSTQDFILADRVPVVHWPELTLLVRVHSNGIASGAGTITIVSVTAELDA